MCVLPVACIRRSQSLISAFMAGPSPRPSFLSDFSSISCSHSLYPSVCPCVCSSLRLYLFSILFLHPYVSCLLSVCLPLPVYYVPSLVLLSLLSSPLPIPMSVSLFYIRFPPVSLSASLLLLSYSHTLSLLHSPHPSCPFPRPSVSSSKPSTIFLPSHPSPLPSPL